jgi:photosystem II stability/assembly factor-like uncharacterized protein
MSKQPSRGWFGPLFARRRSPIRHRSPAPSTRLDVERFEERLVPSISIPLNGSTWTHIGPSPMTTGAPTLSGRINGIAVDPTAAATSPDTIYVASDSGGIWRTTDGGITWSPRTDTLPAAQRQPSLQDIRVVPRTGGNTVYAFDQLGNLYVSTDGAKSFTVTTPPFETNPTLAGTVAVVVNKLSVFVVNPNDPTQDILYAAVGSEEAFPPPSSLGGFGSSTAYGSGIWRSTDGGATWTNLVDSTMAPFTTNPASPIPADSFSFTDVAVDPTNANIVYAALGNTMGDPTNGVYKTTNALSANPTWMLLIGGSAFLPGESPGNIKIAVSPTQPSVVFASLALRNDPVTGFAPLEGVFRSEDAGANWTPVLIANPNNQVNDPLNFMNIHGDDNNFIVVAPTSPTDPNAQTVYVGGYGSTTSSTVLLSTNSGSSWAPIGAGTNSAVFPNIHDGGFDSRGRLIVATGGGVFRLDSVSPVVWESLNGTPGPNALDVSQFNGFALSPNSADQAVGNSSFRFDIASNPGPSLHNALLFSDQAGAGNSAYGWQIEDTTGFETYVGAGQVIYNPFNPQTVYRVTPGNNGQNQFIRRSDDGGQTWMGVTSGFQSSPFNPGLYTVPLAIDPSSPNRLFSGFNQVQVTDTNGDNWGTSMQFSVTGKTVAIPNLPTTGVDGNHGGPIGLTSIGVGRASGVDFGGSLVNGVTLFAATQDDATYDVTTANHDPKNQAAFLGPQLFVNLIPTNQFQWPPPGGYVWDSHSWSNITPTTTDPVTGQTVPALNFGDTIDQILVDPSNNNTIYVVARSFNLTTGQEGVRVFEGTGFTYTLSVGANKTFVGQLGNATGGPGGSFEAATITWTELTANLPAGIVPSDRPQDLALDTGDHVLYAGTGNGVYKLTDFSGAGTWTKVGVDPVTGDDTLPTNVPISALSLNTSTGILGAATYGRGVYEIQVRGLITGHVFTDTNGNGKFDTGEPVFPGVTVEVLDQNTNAIIASTTTDANGFYQFRSLQAGNYKVVALFNANGFVQTTAEPTTLATFTETSTATVDLGYFQPGSISGFKYLDLNGDGTRESNEPGLGGFTIQLLNGGTVSPGGILTGGTVIASMVTASDGSFSFTNLGPAVLNGVANPAGGPYYLREVQKPGYVATSPAAGTVLTVNLQSGQALTDEDFGNRHPSSSGSGTPPIPVAVYAEDAGGQPLVTMQNLATHQVALSLLAYSPAFQGGVRVATGFFTGNSLPDLVTAPGPGGGPHIKLINGTTGATIASFYAFSPVFTGGCYVAVGDINADGTPDIIVGADAGGGPQVKVFDGASLLTGTVKVLDNFYAYSPFFSGGVRVASTDVNRDGFDDIVVAAGPGGGPQVEVFSGALLSSNSPLALTPIRSFYAYAAAFTGGVNVAAGDVNGDGFGDIITGPGLGGGPHLKVFNGALNGALIAQGFAFPFNAGGQIANQFGWSSGLRVATVDYNQDGLADIIVAPGPGRGPFVRVKNGQTLADLLPQTQFTVFNPAFLGGVFVAGD